ncbi:MAG: hypothetical protein CR217_03920 [Beijerinckiaceae bacterium]|nr:MAG: hypothetical protein CR217_03920 [Beijerinckiaceae bacterium]
MVEKFDFRSSPAKPPQLTKAAPESIAIEVLTFLAGNPGRLDRFLALSGLGRDSLRAAAGEPGFLAAILDHLASDESLLLAFAARAGHAPATIAKARDILSPPAEML